MSPPSATAELSFTSLPTPLSHNKRPHGQETFADVPAAKKVKVDEISEWENAVISTGLVAIFTDNEWYLPRVLDTSVKAMQEIDRVSKQQLKLLEGPETVQQRKVRENKEKREREKEEKEAKIGTPDLADKEVTSGTAKRRNKAKAETAVKKAAATTTTTTKHDKKGKQGKEKAQTKKGRGKKKSMDDEYVQDDE